MTKANKDRKRKPSKLHDDESILQSSLPNTGMKTRTAIGQRFQCERMDKHQNSSSVTYTHKRHGLKSNLVTDPNKRVSQNVMENDSNNMPVEENATEMEHTNASDEDNATESEHTNAKKDRKRKPSKLHDDESILQSLPPNPGMKTRTAIGQRFQCERVDKHQNSSSVTYTHKRHGLKSNLVTDPNKRMSQNGMENHSNNLTVEENAIEGEHTVASDEDNATESEHTNASYKQLDIDSDTNSESGVERVPRGPTYMERIWGRSPNLSPLEVEYDDIAKPIGGECNNLSSFLGSLARNGKYCPLDVINWHKMPKEKKLEMLNVVKARFCVPPKAEKWILHDIAKAWRNWKHSLKTTYWADAPIESLIDERDERVLLDQWVKILAYWNSQEAKNISKRNKKAREKRVMKPKTGKTSHAKVQSKLRKKKGRSPSPIEMFAACYGDPNENLTAEISSKHGTSKECNSQFQESLDDPQHQNNRLLVEHESNLFNTAEQSIHSTEKRRSSSRVDPPRQSSSSTTLQRNATISPHAMDGAYVSLMSLLDPTRTVAKGRIQSTDPGTKIGGQAIGANWCEIMVKVIVQPDEQLIRPYDNIQIIADTLGEMIAWPLNLVKHNED